MLDMSGSMMSVRDEVVEGFNDYLKGLKEDESGETLVSLTVFDDVFEHWSIATPVAEVPYMDSRYAPRGMTALHDAIAHSIIETDRKLKELGRESMNVLHVTFTDGGENASKDYSRSTLAQLVKEYEKKGWTFVYLGAAHATIVDAQVTAKAMGYEADNSMMFTASAPGVALSSLSVATSTMRSSGNTGTSSFFADAGQSVSNYTVTSGGHPSGKAPASKPPSRRRSVRDTLRWK